MSPEKIRSWLHFLAIYYWKCSHRCNSSPAAFCDAPRSIRRTSANAERLHMNWIAYVILRFVSSFRSGPRCRLPQLQANERANDMWAFFLLLPISVLSFDFNWFDWIMGSATAAAYSIPLMGISIGRGKRTHTIHKHHKEHRSIALSFFSILSPSLSLLIFVN